MSNINVMSDINLLKYNLISIIGSKYENRNRQLWFIDRISEIFWWFISISKKLIVKGNYPILH
jgi:hypothetical protein